MQQRQVLTQRGGERKEYMHAEGECETGAPDHLDRYVVLFARYRSRLALAYLRSPAGNGIPIE